jgi:hypothetical protein
MGWSLGSSGAVLGAPYSTLEFWGRVSGVLVGQLKVFRGDVVGEPPEDPDTGRYEESDPNWPLCTVFIFLALVLLYFILVEIKR